jgi:hypothetical protein
VGEVGHLQPLRGETPYAVRHEARSHLLRAHRSQHRGEVHLAKELLQEAKLGEGVARKLLADLAYRSEDLAQEMAGLGVLLVTSEASGRRPGVRQQVEIAFSSLKRIFGLGGTLARTLVGLATRIAAKITAYTYALYINRLLGRPQGRIKELCGLEPDNTHLGRL